MKKEIVNEANNLLHFIQVCEERIKLYKIFISQDEVIISREVPREDSWKYGGTEYFKLDLEKDDYVKNYYLSLINALIDREELKVKELQKQFDVL